MLNSRFSTDLEYPNERFVRKRHPIIIIRTYSICNLYRRVRSIQRVSARFKNTEKKFPDFFFSTQMCIRAYSGLQSCGNIAAKNEKYKYLITSAKGYRSNSIELAVGLRAKNLLSLIQW